MDVISHFLITQAKNRHPTDNKGLAKQSDKKAFIIVSSPGKGPNKKGRRAHKDSVPHCRHVTHTLEKETEDWARAKETNVHMAPLCSHPLFSSFRMLASQPKRSQVQPRSALFKPPMRPQP